MGYLHVQYTTCPCESVRRAS